MQRRYICDTLGLPEGRVKVDHDFGRSRKIENDPETAPSDCIKSFDHHQEGTRASAPVYLGSAAASKAASRDDSRKPGGFPFSASRRASADGPQWLNGQTLSPYERVSFTPDGCADENYFHSGRPADSGGRCTVINTCIEARHIPSLFSHPLSGVTSMTRHDLKVSPPELVSSLLK